MLSHLFALLNIHKAKASRLMLSEHSDAGFVLEESIFLQFAPPLYT
jgi:hypothetical protein